MTLAPAKAQGSVVQSIVCLTSSLRVILLTVLADSIYNILIFFAEKKCAKATHIFFSKKFQHICVSLDVNFNKSLTNVVVSFEQLGPDQLSTNAPSEVSDQADLNLRWAHMSRGMVSCNNCPKLSRNYHVSAT